MSPARVLSRAARALTAGLMAACSDDAAPGGAGGGGDASRREIAIRCAAHVGEEP